MTQHNTQRCQRRCSPHSSAQKLSMPSAVSRLAQSPHPQTSRARQHQDSWCAQHTGRLHPCACCFDHWGRGQGRGGIQGCQHSTAHSLFPGLDCCIVGAEANGGQLDAAASKAVEELVQHIQCHAGVIACRGYWCKHADSTGQPRGWGGCAVGSYHCCRWPPKQVTG